MPFDSGITHYDQAPPDVIEDLQALQEADRFRFANELRAWIEVEGDKVVDCGYSGSGHMGSTTVRLVRSITLPGVMLADRQRSPLISDQAVQFVQTSGGRTGLPAPRPVPRRPFFQIASPIVWTTLGLTINIDGSSSAEVLGASTFPRHWVYDEKGKLVKKSGLIDFRTWWNQAFGERTPWGDQDSPALMTEVETALERELSPLIMKGERSIRRVAKGATLVEQGEPGNQVFLLLDGTLAAEVDGKVVAEIGPGAILGERAALEGGRRTATLRAVTPCRVAIADAARLAEADRLALSREHRREEASPSA
jgi:hypothetical protein